MSQHSGQTPPPMPQAVDALQGSAVRRYHTISSASGRMGPRIVERRDSEEAADEEEENEDEWTGGAAMSSEKQASLQRNLSLPAKYHRATRDQPSAETGSLTPSKTAGGLASLDAGPEDEEWSGVAATMFENDENDQLATSQTNPEHLYSPSPPSPAGAVRRHVSMTDGQRAKKGGGLQRHPTMSAKPPMRSSTMNATTEASDDQNEAQYYEGEGGDYDDPSMYPPESAYGGIQQSNWDQSNTNEPGWRNNGNPPVNGEWRPDQQQQSLDEVTRGLASLGLQQQQGANNYARAAPRFDPNTAAGYQDYAQQLQQQTILNQAQRMQLNTEVQAPSGPASASAYVPVPGHSSFQNRESIGSGEDLHRSLSGSDWEHKGRGLRGRGSNASIGQGLQGQYNSSFGNMPPPPPIPTQYLNQVQSGRMASGASMPMGVAGYGPGSGPGQGFGAVGVSGLPGQNQGLGSIQQQHQPPLLDPASILGSPIDVPSMIAQKGYNPATFETRPPFARYFVIKSYTEDDVHKSLKYEIWSSTDPGNKRLDKAFKECAGRGPIYLFFSVNASGHFCGMAEMLTSVDYTRSSTVWASDKWKGVFKVRWIFVRDIPNAVLRNIRLNNTQERKPVTNSRDTQELLPEAGHEMLRIFFTHPAKTSLLQDFAFYELQSLQKQQQAQMGISPLPGATSPPQMHAQLNHHLPGGGGNTMGFNQQQQHQMPQSPPQVMSSVFGQMGGAGGGGGSGLQNSGGAYVGPIGMGIGTQVAQSVLRGSSPGPGPIGSGMGGGGGSGGYQHGNAGHMNGKAGGGGY